MGKPLETLLITGENNHDWARSAPFCRDLLNGSGLFRVDLVEKPAPVLADPAILAGYRLFFVDYNGADWGARARAGFAAAVRGGAGACLLHAADNSFPGWREYEEMCALAWREGTSHGTYHRFDVTLVDQEHPVTRGLPPVLKNHPDELYHRLVHMHRAPYRVLATAFSSPESGGTGRDEPVLLVKRYGRGRVFHCILGHAWAGGVMDTFENPDFQRLLLRGCLWAATGRVRAGLQGARPRAGVSARDAGLRRGQRSQ